MKSHDNIDSFQVGQTNIKCDDNVTLLGINLDYILKFDTHVSEICKKSFPVSSFETFWSILTKQGTLIIYNSFIALRFSYHHLHGIFAVYLALTNSKKSKKGP